MTDIYFVYLARCADGTIYTGMTSNLPEREKRHNQGHGSRYTRGRIPIRIVYSETFLTRKEAAGREYELKGWPKMKKERLIIGQHPNTNK